MDSFEQLSADFQKELAPLSVRARSLFFLLSAYRLLRLSEPYQVSQGRDPKALHYLADEIFQHIVEQQPVSEELIETWEQRGIDLCPGEHEGGFVGPLIEYTCSILWVASGMLQPGGPLCRSTDSLVEYCLSSFRYAIGADLFNITYPGDREADGFYAAVMKDPRFETAVRRLEEDLADLKQNDGDRLAGAAEGLKERALRNQADVAEFPDLLGKLEKKYYEERERRRKELG